jgi:hypothetical protein
MDFRRVRMIKVSEKPGEIKLGFDHRRSSTILFGQNSIEVLKNDPVYAESDVYTTY